MATERRLIDANALTDQIIANFQTATWYGASSEECQLALDTINESETVDAVEVVRCKDCFANGCCSVQDALDMGDEGYCPKGRNEN